MRILPMVSIELVIVLLIGALIMCAMIALQMKWYSIAWWKGIVISAALVLTGVFGSQIWFFVENLEFGGRSFYGAIFFSPLVFWPLSKLLRIPYGEALDFVAPAGCLTLALVKIQCLRDGCCLGRILYVDENHMYVRFPSQIVEMAAFLLISAILFALCYRGKIKGKIFPCFLVLYGASRFVLDFLRDVIAPYALGLSAGSFWSMISVIAGIIWLMLVKRRKNSARHSERSEEYTG